MANELLDFVMSLVRDTDAAARYAADPDRVLADARLDGVTSADVNNLLPMVADSVAMSTPLFGARETGDGNVWTSGAATAAFDSFTPHVTAPHESAPAVGGAAALPTTHPQKGNPPVHDTGSPFDDFDTFTQFDTPDMATPVLDDASPAGVEPVGWDAWGHGDGHGGAGHSGVDLNH